MTADEEKQLQAMFAAGDPAARLPAMLPQRVAARLAERPARTSGFSFARAAAVSVALASSAVLGAAGVWVTHELRQAQEPEAPAPAKARAVAPAAAPADPLAVEAGLLRASLEALQRGDADAALANLDERQHRFPAGALEAEAAVARARALMLAHRDDEALAAFEAVPASELTAPLALTWADLLVARGRCPRALEVLQGVEAEGEEARVAAALKMRCAR
jgi:hypothetical protein